MLRLCLLALAYHVASAVRYLRRNQQALANVTQLRKKANVTQLRRKKPKTLPTFPRRDVEPKWADEATFNQTEFEYEPDYQNREPMKFAYVKGLNPTPCMYAGFHADCNPHMERISFKTMRKPRLIESPTGSARIKIYASSVNPNDWMDLWRPDPYRKTIGGDIAGVVEEASLNCSFDAGDEVWGISPYLGFAEYTSVDCNQIGLKPAGLDMLQAASLPTVALTSLTALKRLGAPWDNHPTVVILGGSSSTGLCAIQFAKSMGAGTVITTTSPAHFELVKRLGADEVIDYHTARWWEVLARRSISFVYDCVPMDQASLAAFAVVRPGGKYITLQRNSMPNMAMPFAVSSNNVTAEYMLFEHGTNNLDTVKESVEQGHLQTVIDSVYHFRDLRPAMEHSYKRHSTGKVVVKMVD